MKWDKHLKYTHKQNGVPLVSEVTCVDKIKGASNIGCWILSL